MFLGSEAGQEDGAGGFRAGTELPFPAFPFPSLPGHPGRAFESLRVSGTSGTAGKPRVARPGHPRGRLLSHSQRLSRATSLPKDGAKLSQARCPLGKPCLEIPGLERRLWEAPLDQTWAGQRVPFPVFLRRGSCRLAGNGIGVGVPHLGASRSQEEGLEKVGIATKSSQRLHTEIPLQAQPGNSSLFLALGNEFGNFRESGAALLLITH